MTNSEEIMKIATNNYLSICKAVFLQQFEDNVEDAFDTAFECNDGDIITNEEILNVYIKVINKFL
ncbi:hypothetical protein K2F43_06045 [Clostridium estertheticum]|uniref:hypothetical protein n=1 Tax=Clostridium estertheticum TaxID=238834 RepID=UPI001C6E1AF4|nr:hypothetical protein [Clostridium estertheticum]MBW9170767.1 hypothetical protein [Clostridium estertheticum]WLC74394.1 hypothetical protein KTC99_16710 [Clostridium estertheticum]